MFASVEGFSSYMYYDDFTVMVLCVWVELPQVLSMAVTKVVILVPKLSVS